MRKNWLQRKQMKKILHEAGLHLLLIPAALVFLVPFIWMLSTSLKSDAQLYVYPPIWIPIPPQWSNYPTPSVT